MAYQLTLDDEFTKVTGSDHANEIAIEQIRNKGTGEYLNKVYLTFSDLAEIVNWANRNMGALVMAQSNQYEPATDYTCSNCNGSGQVQVYDSEHVSTCDLCDGMGEITQ